MESDDGYLDYSYYGGEDYIYPDELRQRLNLSNTELDDCDLLRTALVHKVGPSLSFVDQMSTENCSDYLNKLFDEYPEYVSHNITLHHYDLSVYLRFSLLAVVIPVGLLFNLLSCAVFLRTRMQKSAMVFYFVALSCADNIVLLGELLFWLNTYTSKGYITGLDFVDRGDKSCKFVFFIRYCGRLISSWLVVTICIERFIAIAYPLRRTWSSPKTAVMVITGITAVCIVLSCPSFFMLGPRYHPHHQRDMCAILNGSETAYGRWITCVIVVGELVIPSIIVIIFTTLIIIKLKKVLPTEDQTQQRSDHKDHQLTIALLAVAIAFVTLRAPYILMYPLHWHQNVIFQHHTHSQMKRFFLAFDITYVFAVTNYAINFFLYVITSRRFRSEFKKFLFCKKSQLGSTGSKSQATSLQQYTIGEELHCLNDHQVQTDKIIASTQEAQL